MKTCSNCAINKPTSHFGKDAQRPDGLRVYCKPCVNGKQRERRLAASPIDKYEQAWNDIEHLTEIATRRMKDHPAWSEWYDNIQIDEIYEGTVLVSAHDWEDTGANFRCDLATLLDDEAWERFVAKERERLVRVREEREARVAEQQRALKRARYEALKAELGE